MWPLRKFWRFKFVSTTLASGAEIQKPHMSAFGRLWAWPIKPCTEKKVYAMKCPLTLALPLKYFPSIYWKLFLLQEAR